MTQAMTPDLDKIADEVRHSFDESKIGEYTTPEFYREFARRLVERIQREQKAEAYQQRSHDELDGWSGWQHIDHRHVELVKNRTNYQIRPLFTFPPATPRAVPDGLAELLAEAATCIEKVRDADYDAAWEKFGIRDFLADELHGSALMLSASTPSAVPDGWQLVPKKPTPEMVAACHGYVVESWQAMLSAAPAPAGEKFLGLNVVVASGIPDDEVRFVQDGKVVGRITGLSDPAGEKKEGE